VERAAACAGAKTVLFTGDASHGLSYFPFRKAERSLLEKVNPGMDSEKILAPLEIC